MHEIAYRWSNIGDMNFFRARAVRYTPPHQHKRNVTVVWVPATVSCAVAYLLPNAIHTRLQYQLDVTTTLTVIAFSRMYDGTLADAMSSRSTAYITSGLVLK